MTNRPESINNPENSHAKDFHHFLLVNDCRPESEPRALLFTFSAKGCRPAGPSPSGLFINRNTAIEPARTAFPYTSWAYFSGLIELSNCKTLFDCFTYISSAQLPEHELRLADERSGENAHAQSQWKSPPRNVRPRRGESRPELVIGNSIGNGHWTDKYWG